MAEKWDTNNSGLVRGGEFDQQQFTFTKESQHLRPVGDNCMIIGDIILL